MSRLDLERTGARNKAMIDLTLKYMEEIGHTEDQLPLVPHMQDIKKKFDREMALPPERVDFIPRSDLVETLRITKEQTDEFRKEAAKGFKNGAEVEMGIRQRYSSKNLDSLERIPATELMIRKVHEGRYFLCRTICPTVSDAAVAILAAGEDPDGNAVYLKFYNHPLLFYSTWNEMDSIVFPIGTVLAIREPFYVGGAFSGPSEFPFIKVDSPSDIVVLDADHDILRDVSWKTKLSLPPPGYPRPPVTGEAWKARGAKEFKSGRWFASAMCFTKCIDIGYEVEVARLNRSEVYLRLDWNSSAFRDAEAALESGTLDDNLKTKAVIRMMKARYARGQYDKVLEIAKSSPEDKAVSEWTSKAAKRKAEQTTGYFDWATLFKEAKQPSYCPDIGNFTGPLEVGFREGPIKIRGTFATRDVNVGELLIFEKPISSYYHKGKDVDLKIHSVPLRRTCDERAIYRHFHAVIQKIWEDEEAYGSVRALYGGSNQPQPSEAPPTTKTSSLAMESPLRPVVDIDVDYVFGAVLSNSFGCGTVYPTPDPETASKDDGYALYKTASLLNHSCAPSTQKFFLGDAIVVRAIRDIKKGEEITAAYIDHNSAYDERNFRLRRSWGFRCTCDLCVNDSKDDIKDRKKREELTATMAGIFQSVNRASTPGVLRQLVGKAKACCDDMRRTYTGDRTTGTYADAVKFDLADATRWYAACVERLTGIEANPSATYRRTLEVQMDSLELEGLHVNDRSMSGPIVGGKDAPFPLDLTFVSPMLDMCLITIFKMTKIFEGLGEKKRAQRWFDAGVELHNLRKGGGKAVFKIYQAEMLDLCDVWGYL